MTKPDYLRCVRSVMERSFPLLWLSG